MNWSSQQNKMESIEFQISNGQETCNDKTKMDVNDMLLFLQNMSLTLMYTAFEFIFKYYKNMLVAVILVITLYLLYKSYWSPVLYKKELADIGFNHINKSNKDLNIQRAQMARKQGNKLPPPYPNGWYVLVESRDLHVGGVLPVDALGLNLCVYRGEDGVARVVDAYCPHLGANLGVGGIVCGNCIECPFHLWRFGENGDLVKIPGVENVPRGISIKTWPSREIDGAVWIWYDAEKRDPLWTTEECYETKHWGYRGRNEFIISSHIQEIPENGADVAHLNAVHINSTVSDIGSKYPFMHDVIGYHVWNADWVKGSEGEEHMAYMKLKHQYLLLKKDILPIDVKIQQIGPAHVRLSFTSPLGPMLVVQSITPIGPLLQKVVHRIYTPSYNAPFGVISVYLEAFQFQRDVVIWNSKTFVSNPTYAKTDKAIRAFRTWYSQFYSENSISFRDASQKPYDW